MRVQSALAVHSQSALARCDIACYMQGHVYYSETDSLERWYKPKWITDVDHVPSEPVCLGKIHVRFEPFAIFLPVSRSAKLSCVCACAIQACQAWAPFGTAANLQRHVYGVLLVPQFRCS